MIGIQRRVSRVFIPAVILICILVIAFKNRIILLPSVEYSKAAEIINKDVVIGSPAPVLQANEAGNNLVLAPEKTEQEWNPVMRNEAKRAEIIKWFASRGTYGFNGPDENDDYQNYNEETLKKLDETGDMRAMNVLADRQETLNKKEVYLRRAALYGSTNALQAIATSIEIKGDFQHMSTEEKRPNVISLLAFYEAARLRGDQWTYMDADSLLRLHQIELTQQDKDFVRASGKRIYDELQQERNKMGLGDFDNSVPDVVNEFFAETISNSCNKKYTNNPPVLTCSSH